MFLPCLGVTEPLAQVGLPEEDLVGKRAVGVASDGRAGLRNRQLADGDSRVWLGNERHFVGEASPVILDEENFELSDDTVHCLCSCSSCWRSRCA